METHPKSRDTKKIKMIDSLWLFITATAFLGPFALPLLWRNPRYSKKTKVSASVFIILLTLGLLYLMFVVLADFVKAIQENSP
ncbi:MAG: hypothetical protein EB078_01205 [Proteobacteria bacterium]|nr:hypothetical protein [Pseudomonadota bacterium]NDC23241.1 hypothetical protein [Pseudomonadota bacterium]NDD03497.1 hypothetical protein [Pseudomonadota bacterium]NDG26315.1 hypothetical protein [Pseudomonadota bacterium]